MKIKITMKDPDGPFECIRDAVKDKVKELVADGHLSAEEAESLEESRIQAETAKCSKWLEYGEYITVEIDTDAGTAVVLPA